ncbi:hypothetical protein RR42_s1595 [Cupriavidus basilensis]|uniref:Fumarylacetoacetate hydrolase family protein n=1 Tax=Cupriavidus basilensis TaxID=68895 RepID=A0A0C4YJJ5_9BURK|nr:hypothetical protein RR42_s1595 [Cupriavidus basilensis]
MSAHCTSDAFRHRRLSFVRLSPGDVIVTGTPGGVSRRS